MKTARKAQAKRSSRGGRPPADQAESRNEALLDAATGVFLEAGYSGAKMATIAERAGASKETLYARYPNKLQLFAALVMRKTSHLHEVLGPLNSEHEPEQELKRYGVELVSMIVMPEMQTFHRMVIAGSIHSPELGIMLWEAGPGRGFEMLCTYFEKQKNRGALEIEDPECAARILIGMIVGEMSIRTTLGLRPTIRTKAAIRDWVSYVVDKFLATFACNKPEKLNYRQRRIAVSVSGSRHAIP